VRVHERAWTGIAVKDGLGTHGSTRSAGPIKTGGHLPDRLGILRTGFRGQRSLKFHARVLLVALLIKRSAEIIID